MALHLCVAKPCVYCNGFVQNAVFLQKKKCVLQSCTAFDRISMIIYNYFYTKGKLYVRRFF